MTIGRAPKMSEKLGSVLLYYLDAIGEPIPLDHAKAMSTDQILSLFEFDHWPIRRADGGSNHPTNLKPRFKLEHRHKTAKKDAPEMAKDRAIARVVIRHDAAIEAKLAGDPVIERKPRWAHGRKLQSRPFPQGHRPMQSRNTFKDRRRP